MTKSGEKYKTENACPYDYYTALGEKLKEKKMKKYG